MSTGSTETNSYHDMTRASVVRERVAKMLDGDGSTIKYELFVLKLQLNNPNMCILKLFCDQFS